ncbi:hypothetical protein [Aquicella lusitana]|uniref:Uncharacterized protein n=1 Tax=Aquicella lusitana TaxID=254246 RepID=A0A370GP92_9COXI|nr:hypothetical protein [Aquicella lusitana]RDI45179.1 hypothetical protein C8D86_10758 [Aquicella lusitana]VVC72751.1 hypothetical protein AQULUS_04720 [Aquicella lusitana]
MVKLLIDQTDNTLVDLSSGKLSKKGARKPIKRQKGMTCTLYGMRRIAFFESSNQNDSIKEMIAYKTMKNALMNFNHDYAHLAEIAFTLCQNLNIDLETALSLNSAFMNRFIKRANKALSKIEYLTSLEERGQWIILYDILTYKILLPLLHLENAAWHPRDGFNKLKESLRNHGAHAFMGKFGAWCHNEKPQPFMSETTQNRHVFYFRKNTYMGDYIPFTHCVIVDQLKIVNGKEMVFFRDPNSRSAPNKPEKIFMLSFENFVSRLTDWQGNRFILNCCPDETSFGFVSTQPERLTSGI